MKFYGLSKEERIRVVEQTHSDILDDLNNNRSGKLKTYFSDTDTYARKNVYLSIGRIYKANKGLQPAAIIKLLSELMGNENEKIRQTVINAAGEIGMVEFNNIEAILEKGFYDERHSVKNAVIGSLKKIGKVNPKPTLSFSQRFLHHPDKDIRRQVIHGIELRGRPTPKRFCLC